MIKKMKKILISGLSFALLLMAGYLFFMSDVGLLDDETCLQIAAVDVLGNPLYGKSCPRSSYVGNVEAMHSLSKDGAAFFKFQPIEGKEVECPSIAVIVDRKTGEAWLVP